MKFLLIIATFFLVQAIAGQELKEHPKLNHHNHGHIGVNVDKLGVHGDNSDHKAHELMTTQTVEQQQLQPSPAAVEIPSKVQQIVSQITQHIPIVIAQHLANQKREKRAGEIPHSCDFICNQVDVAVCGYNGRCYQVFASQCELNTYNCLNTQRIFEIVDKVNCQNNSFPKCYRGDM